MINTSNNKVIMLEKIPGETYTRSEKGEKEYKYFLTDVPLHAIQDESTSLWTMRYNAPAKLPPALQGLQFTTFTSLRKHAEAYFRLRNIRIKDIIENIDNG